LGLLTWRQWAVVALTIFLGVALTLAGFFLARKLEGDRSSASLRGKAADYRDHLQREVDRAIHNIKAIKALYDSSEHVSRKEFKVFTYEMLDSEVGIQALEWVPRVPHARKEQFMEAARREGFPDFTITERVAQDRMQEAEPRKEYFPVFYVEPLKGNELALGFDAGSSPERLHALHKARDTGKMMASHGVKLVQERGQQTGFVLFQPVYSHGATPKTTKERRENLRGFVVGVFRVGDLVEASLAGTPPAGINFTVYGIDADKPPSRLYFHHTRTVGARSAASDDSDGQAASEECSLPLHVADRQWKIVFRATPWFVEKERTYLPWVMLWGGLAATLVLFLSVFGLVRKGVRLDIANQRLEDDLRERERVADEKALFAEVTHLINTSHDRKTLLKSLLARLQAWSGCEAVGIRLRDGHDFPYFETKGFPESFVKAENSLCNRDEYGEILIDSNQEPILDCMCGNILQGRVDPTKSFFTNGGSFWSSCTSDLLAATTESDRQARTRNRCNGAGYESVALVPLRAGGDTFGLIQLNDKRKGRFTEEKIIIIERLANSVAAFLANLAAEEEREKLLKQWELALDAARMGWWLYDPVTKVSNWDERYAEIFQVSGLKGPNEEILKRLHPDDLPMVWAKVEAALNPEDPQPYSAEFRINLPDGSVRWVAAHGLASFEGKGKDRRAVSFAGTVADISQRKQAVETLARSEERYRLLAENTLDVIWTMNLDLEFTYVNNAIFDMTGYTPEEWIGTRLAEHCGDEEFALMAKVIAEESARGAEGAGVIFETIMFNKNREPIWVEIHGKVILDQNGRPVALQGATRDITLRRKAEEARQKMEEQFRAAFENAPEGMALVDGERRFFKVNPRLCQLLGYAEEELLGKTFNQFTHPDDRQAGRDRWRELFTGGASVNRAEKRFLHRNGQVVWTLISNAAIKDKQGRVQYVLSHIYDITERKQIDQALRLSEEKFVKAFQHSPLWAVITTLDEGSYIDVNETFLRVTGYDRDEVIGRTSADLDLRIDPSERDAMVRTLRERGSVQNMEVKRRIRSGKILDMLLFAEMLPMPGEEEAIVVVLADITELKRAQKEKDDLEAQLLRAQKMEAIGTLAGGIAHDFNNILSAILGYAELAEDTAPAESENKYYLGQIMGATKRAQNLVKQILAFSRKAETETRPVDLNRYVSETIKLIRQTIPKMVSIEFHLADTLSLVNADPGQLEQIVMNLATNAKDAMPEGGRLVFETANVFLDDEYCREHLEADPGHYVRLQVSDTGHGMSKEVLNQIFDPFFTTKAIGKGTGLGLSTVYGIVRAHKGFIYCYSEIGQGTIFRIYLPALKAEGEDESPDVTIADHEAAGGGETILVVDDEQALLDIGSRLLTSEGYNVITAGSGEEALNIFKQQKGDIDLVILDVSMPGMGGRKCLEEILRIDPHVKALIASGYSANGQLKDILKAGAAGYIAKPFGRANLLGKIRSVLDGLSVKTKG